LKGYDEPAAAFATHLSSLPVVIEALQQSPNPS
jgi:hypothetical protein